MADGKCVLIGGLARIEVVDSRPFLFTFFVANEIKLHPTSAAKADEFVEKHTGGMLTPPLEGNRSFTEWDEHVVEIQGTGWKEASADIALTGLGWVAVTGPGTAKIKITVPKGVGVAVRPPLMPFDVWDVASKYTGGKATRKGRKKGVGRR